MLRLLKDLDFSKYKTRTWVYSPEDSISITKALAFDNKLVENLIDKGICRTAQVKRARNVGQSWISTIFSSLLSLISCLEIVAQNPDVVSD
jgi:beta-1,4-N-acetylglucosaminyltransferase